MARSKKRTRRQSTEVFDFDPVAIAMKATEEVTRAAIDPTVPNSQQVTTGDISPTTDPTQLVDNARGVGPNNIQQEDEDLQLIPPNGIPGSVALGINFNCDVFKYDFLMRDAAWGAVKMDGKLVEPFNPDELERPRKIIRSNPSKKNEGKALTKRQQGKDAFTIVLDEALQPDRSTTATDGSSLPSSKNGVPLTPNAGAEAPTSRKGKEKMAMQLENAFKDEVRKELRELKEAITMSRREAKAIARSQKVTTTRLGQSSAGPSNHMEGIDVHRGQPAASLQTKSASMAEYKNTVARMLEECKRAVERNTSLEEELVIAQRKIDELEQRVKELEAKKAGIETSYLSICNDFKLVAASHHSPQLFYKHLKSIFDSYVNLDNNPDVQPLVKGFDAEDFDVDAFLGTNMGGRKEEMTPDFLDGLSVHDARRLESKIENIHGEP
ncbi:hypothetical protein R1flu_002908 [Riccia fluitans]|uniref:Uncharacterized protein n=1 Tax=Riccia fluitans TaxID=41844 RepID=A0ABD1Y7G3_9MARC